jgi:deazaflavin-dependent oxidoreductase (nitroreductase family)
VSSIAALADTEYCYLTTIGRRTGAPHRIEIWFVAHDDGAYILSNGASADWFRNLEADPGVTLEIAGERRATNAHVVAAGDAAHEIVRPAMVAKYQSGYAEDLATWSLEGSLVRVEWPSAT